MSGERLLSPFIYEPEFGINTADFLIYVIASSGCGIIAQHKKMATTLHIVGNGFDLAHGIASRYSDFKKYAWKYGNSYQIGLLETCYPNMNPMRKELNLWCDLERALGSPDFQAAFDASTEDIEKEDGHEGRFQAQMEDAPEYILGAMYDAFHEIFDGWVNQIDIDVEPLQCIEHFDKTGLFLSFNYTDTLEKVYGIPRELINYIHGRRNSSDTIIVGHCAMVDADSNLSEEPMIYEYQGYANIANLVNGQRKAVADIILGNANYWKALNVVNKVVVYGHSLSDVDMAYYHEIAKCVDSDCEWYFSIHYNNKEEEAIALRHIQDVSKQLGLDLKKVNTFEL